jgi:hypothetical protein
MARRPFWVSKHLSHVLHADLLPSHPDQLGFPALLSKGIEHRAEQYLRIAPLSRASVYRYGSHVLLSG